LSFSVSFLVSTGEKLVNDSSFRASDDEISFLDLRTTHVPKNARNGNQGSEWGCPLLARLLVTGLIGPLLTPYFLDYDIQARNPKSSIFRGENPALIFPFGGHIGASDGLGEGNEKKACFGGGGFPDLRK